MLEKHQQWEDRLLPSLMDTINYLIKEMPENGVLYDVGANTGLLTQKVIEQRPDVTCVLFEPVNEYYNIIDEKFRYNPKVIFFNCALLDAIGTSNISKHGDNLGYNTITGLDDYGDKEEIQCRTLTSIQNEYKFSKPDIIKVDVEQSESYFIEGCKGMFETYTPSQIIMEIGISNVHPLWEKEKGMIEYLFSLGYKRFDYDKNHTFDAIFKK